jgi:hypothetical protein
MFEPFVARQSNSVQTDLSISSSTLATAVAKRCFTSFKLTGSGGTKTLFLMYLQKKKKNSQGIKSELDNV